MAGRQYNYIRQDAQHDEYFEAFALCQEDAKLPQLAQLRQVRNFAQLFLEREEYSIDVVSLSRAQYLV